MAVALTATPTSAVDDQAEANEIAAVIAEAAPSAERVATPDSTARHGVDFDLGESTVSIPTDANNDVTIESSGKTIDISLPSEIDVEDGALASDGTMVFGESGDTAHAAVQALDDGSVEATETIADGVVATLGLIDAPWAVDSQGIHVPTHYTVDGSKLTQHVEHSAKYANPITADPWVSYGTKIYINYSRSDVRTYAGYTPYGTVTAAVCRYVPIKWAGVACAASLGAYAISINNTFQSANRQGKCVQMSYPYYATAVTMAVQMRWKVVSC